MNLSEMVDRFATDLPDHPALVIEDRIITYSQFLSSTNKLANAFAKAGLIKGDRVIILMGNRPELVTAYFACLRMGAVAVTLNPLATGYELTHYFAECKPSAVVCTSDQVPKIDAIKKAYDSLKAVFATESAAGAIALQEVENDFSSEFKALNLSPDDPAVIIFTAGLLGTALGATLSHRNLDNNSNMLPRYVQWRAP